jgi:hypothetical protein
MTWIEILIYYVVPIVGNGAAGYLVARAVQPKGLYRAIALGIAVAFWPVFQMLVRPPCGVGFILYAIVGVSLLRRCTGIPETTRLLALEILLVVLCIAYYIGHTVLVREIAAVSVLGQKSWIPCLEGALANTPVSGVISHFFTTMDTIALLVFLGYAWMLRREARAVREGRGRSGEAS